MDPCTTFRTRWLELALDARARVALEQDHPAACAACRGWLEARRFQVDALASLPRVELPASLTAVVESDLSEREALLVRALRSLPRCEAPAELDASVARSLAAPSPGPVPSPVAADPERSRLSVRALAYETVPPVLDRLVNEELAAPGQHLAERFVGGLERLAAPARLDARVARLFRRPLRLRVAAAVAIAASLVLAWRLAVPGPPEFRRTVTRVHVEAPPAELGSFARGLAEAVGGGVPASVAQPVLEVR